MADNADSAEIELRCDKCGVVTRRSLEWTPDHEEIVCGCGALIPVDPAKFRKELVTAESNFDGFEGMMEKLGK